MLATFVIEIFLLGYILLKHNIHSLRIRLVSASLFFLAIFQLAEYNVCGGMGLHADWWSRIGFMAITMLPPLGLHLVLSIAGKVSSKLLSLAYGTAAAWMIIFGFTNQAFTSYACGGNYAIFQMRSPYDTFYMAFYFFWLMIAVGIALFYMGKVKTPQRRALEFMVIGYVLFIGPTAIVMTLQPEAIKGLPSIMCGFAILYGLLISFGVAGLEKKLTPRSSKRAKA